MFFPKIATRSSATTALRFVIALTFLFVRNGAAFNPYVKPYTEAKFLSISTRPFYIQANDGIFLKQRSINCSSTQNARQIVKVLSSLHATPDNKDETSLKESEEETLLCVNFSIKDVTKRDSALSTVRSYVRSFPFAAVLPVQPLTYLPTDDGKGVDITFLRKKTKEKGSVDGGIKFSMDFTDVNEGGGESGRKANDRIQLVARRNSEGQTISKIFSEKLIVQAFVAGISGERNDGNNLSEFVAIESIFHKWM